MIRNNKKKPLPFQIPSWVADATCLIVLCCFFFLGSQKSINRANSTAGSTPLPLSSVRYWAYQIQDLELSGAITKIVNSQYDMVVIDPTVTWDYEFDTRDMVSRIKASKASDGIHRKLVIAYIDIGEAEEWRWYWDGHIRYEEKGKCKNSYINAIQTWAPWVVACDPDGWGGNYPVAFWHNDWKDIVIDGTTLGSHLGLYFDSMLDEIVQDGFDGVYLDWVEAWEMDEVQTRAQNEGKDPGPEMLTFIQEIRDYGKQYNPNFLVIQQNSSELINEVGANALKTAVDAIAQEGVWWDGIGGNDDWNDSEGYDYASCCTNYYLPRLRKYRNAGFPVFVCDYALKKADEVYQNAAAEGFIAYATRRSLSKLTTTPPEFEVANLPIIAVNKTQLNFSAVISTSSPGSQSLSISNSGGGTLNWTITDNSTWITCNPASGTDSAHVTVSVDAAGLGTSTYTGTITISAPDSSNSPQTVEVTLNVYSYGEDDEPFGSFATPVDGSTVRSSVAVTGWALDDVGIMSVKIYLETETGLVEIGEAVMVEGARPDIEQAYPGYPMNYKAGWGYMMLTNFLPNGGNGTFMLHAVVMDSSGNAVTLGTKSITCDNANAVKPFGAIDTPSQGGTAAGSSFINWGWVLTPQPNSIPTDGSTINVFLDGVNIGHPNYNRYRQDIAVLFPGYANSNGAVGYFYLDTTEYENGVHTIQWTVEDNAGNTDGIGSRYFTVQNSQGAGSMERRVTFNGNISQIPIDYSATVRFKKGFNLSTNPTKLYPNNKGKLSIEIRELERIEIHLKDNHRLPITHHPSPSLYMGYLSVDGKLRPLPIGSTLDRERGIFYWQPGPGFFGHHQLVFIEKRLSGEMKRKRIIIKIVPRFTKTE